MSLKRIFIDMDGVIADFESSFQAIAKMSTDEFNTNNNQMEFWATVYEDPNFFINLPCYEYSQKLVELCQQNCEKVSILSCPSRVNTSLCVLQKRQWVDKYFGTEFPAIFEQNKTQFSKPDVLLIDDREKTINAWRAAGGEGILFKNFDDYLVDFEALITSNQS